MIFWAYILRCADGKYYTGHTDDLDRRIAQHVVGAIPGYTADRRPVELIWSETFQTREEAKEAEARIKSWSRARKEALIRGDMDALCLAAVPPHGRADRALAALGTVPRLRSGKTGGREEIIDAARKRDAAVLRCGTSTGSVPTQDKRVAGKESVGASPPPVLVLVRPQLGENIGKAARAMLNFGLTELRLVSPRDGWPNPSAGPAASGADVVLEQARVYDSVAAATADCAHVFATTVRKRGITKPVVTPEQAAGLVRAGPGRAAILFGPERAGLETDDVAVARTIITVPINPAFGSLNLAQAVILIAYEWSKGEGLASPPATDLDPPASQFELDGMIAQLDAMLEAAGFFHLSDRAPVTRRTLRTLLTKPGWNAQEVRTLRGVLSTLAKPRRRGLPEESDDAA